MRYRIKEYSITGQTILLDDRLTIEDIRLIVNETQKVVICSSMQKSNVQVQSNYIVVPIDICTLNANDKLTIEIDKRDSFEDVKEEIKEEVRNLAIDEALREEVSIYDDTISMQLQSIIGDV